MLQKSMPRIQWKEKIKNEKEKSGCLSRQKFQKMPKRRERTHHAGPQSLHYMCQRGRLKHHFFIKWNSPFPETREVTKVPLSA